MTAQINAERLWGKMKSLAEITDADRPYTRRSFTPLHLEGRRWLSREFEAAGLSVRLDTVANLIGRREGAGVNSSPLVIGSHSDTVPDGGRFDGIAGILTGLEVALSLRENGVVLRHPLEIIDFLAEEPSVFGMSCIGSRLMAGHLSEEGFRISDSGGETLADAIRRMGGDPARRAEAVRSPGSIAGYVEVHIEQGRVLQERKIPIGIVTEIVGITRYNIVVEGCADHAGNTPMGLRTDALAAASRLVLRAEDEARALNAGDVYFVATVGQLTVEPNATNVVPGRVRMGLECRSGSNEARIAFAQTLKDFAATVMRDTGVRIGFDPVSDADPAVCSVVVREAIREACAKRGFGHLDMPSGAGHDAMHITDAGPMGMIFIPCRDGRSHCPEEWVEPEELAAGAETLYETILNLDSRCD